eukprot:gene370-biopygen10616
MGQCRTARTSLALFPGWEQCAAAVHEGKYIFCRAHKEGWSCALTILYPTPCALRPWTHLEAPGGHSRRRGCCRRHLRAHGGGSGTGAGSAGDQLRNIPPLPPLLVEERAGLAERGREDARDSEAGFCCANCNGF